MLNYKDAQLKICSMARSFGKEAIGLDDCFGRVLAEPVIADRDYPPFNRATMDGYALKFSDFEKRIHEYPVAETIFAGQQNSKPLMEGGCFKIMTGAAVPEGADMVIRREDTTEDNGVVRVNVTKGSLFQNMAIKGEDLKASETILGVPTFCTAPLISLLASVGKSGIVVERLPRVAVFTTGNEIVSIDASPVNLSIRNSNQHLLKALLKKWKVEVHLCAHVPDDKEELRKVIGASLEMDIVIICGGVSAGDADYVPEVLESLGVKKLFHKVDIKPGKPLLCGVLPNGGMLFALPGNPFSCQVTFTLFIETYLAQCFGIGEKPLIKLPLLKSRTKKSSLDEFFPVLIKPIPAGLEPIIFNGSGDIRAGVLADGLAVHPASIDTIEPGSLVEFISYSFP